jgi:hypothetical protein
MQATDITWSPSEQSIAKEAFDCAYARETNALIQQVNQAAASLSELDDLWKLNDYLSARRHALDGKYDYQYSFLIFLFAQLLKEGWLDLTDLAGLEKDKLAKITSLARM